MKAQNKFTILIREQKKTKSKIVLGNGIFEDYFTVHDSDKFKKGDKVVCSEFPSVGFVENGVDYHFIETEKICASL